MVSQSGAEENHAIDKTWAPRHHGCVATPPLPLAAAPRQHQVLIVDDEPDVHRVTRLSLKALKPGGQPLVVHSAHRGAEGVEIVRQHPEIAVILLDVVMETDHAGLDACRAIRAFNPFVRILLQTGQPGSAPERQTIDDYDLDGYLPKAELTSNRLYTEVRAGLRAFEQIVALERNRRALARLNECVASLHSFEALDVVLGKLLGAALEICPAPLAVLWLETFDAQGNPSRVRLHLSSDGDAVRGGVIADEIVARVTADPAGARAEGVLLPVRLHRELGHGWIYLQGGKRDELMDQVLPMLAEQATNALYATVALKMLARAGEVFEEMPI
jgi:CheY-like chemotaxis protein